MKALMMSPMKSPPIKDPEPRQQPAGDQGADDADDDVADQPEAAALYDHAGKPAGNCADDQPNNDAHVSPLFPCPGKGRFA